MDIQRFNNLINRAKRNLAWAQDTGNHAHAMECLQRAKHFIEGAKQ